MKIIIKEFLLYFLIASCIIMVYSIVYNLFLWKILSCISILLSKIFYEDYVSKFYFYKYIQK